MTAPASSHGIDRLIVQIAAAINTRALYAEGHPRVARAVQSVVDAVAASCAERRQPDVSFLIVGDDLVVDDRPLRAGGLYQQNFVRTLRRRGVERLTLARGLDVAECTALVAAIAENRVPPGSPHVIVGRVEVATAEQAEGGGPEPVSVEQLEGGREAFARFRADRRASIHKLEEMVWSLMETLARSARDVLVLAPLKNHDDYTFVHAVNVSMLVMAQARSFGIQGQLLHQLGLAATCHDIGKLEIPLEVLNRPGPLVGADWELMKTHAELGAWKLADTPDVPPLSVIVAYEHHMRFDGRPSYPLVSKPVRPSIASQMTAVADVYDAVSTLRPYQRARTRDGALAVLRDRAGTYLDPFLVGNFHRLLGQPLPE